MKTEDDDRITWPEIDESIFYPERKWQALGLDENDLADVIFLLNWILQEREKGRLREMLVKTLRAQQKQIADFKKRELLRELSELEKLNQAVQVPSEF